MPLALTRTRLKGFITLRSIPGGTFVANPADISGSLDGTKIIGAVQQLDIVQERETNSFRREFGPESTEDGGIPAETYPGLPHFSATLHRTDLYEANMLEAFGFDSVNLAAQFAPLLIYVSQPVPVGADGNALKIPGGTMKRRTYVLDGVWFNNMPLQFNITDADQKQVVECEITFRNIRAFSI